MERPHAQAAAPPDRSPPTRLIWVGAFLLLLLAGLPRAFELDRLVTPDEPLWLSRSANFYAALSDGDLERTYQFVHPGVTTMWAGTFGYLWAARDYADDGPTSIPTRNNEISAELRRQGIEPLQVLAAGRFFAAAFITITITLSGVFAMRLFGVIPGLIGGALLATDPFHIALSRLLHVDGLASSFAGLAALAWLAYLLDGRKRRDLIVAGIALGLAGLTRSTVAVLLPMVLVSAALDGGPRYQTEVGRARWRRFRPVLTLGLIALGTYVTLWPAMWVSPIQTIERVVQGTFRLGEKAHEEPVFFNGAVYDEIDPGALFYPVSYLWRTSPAVLIGLGLAAIAVVWRLVSRGRPHSAVFSTLFGLGRTQGPPLRPISSLDRSISEPRHVTGGRAAAYLALLSVCGLLLLTAGEKKLDRYIVLIVPPAAFVAGWGYGWVGVRLAGWLRPRSWRPRWRLSPRVAGGAMAAMLLLTNLLSVAEARPYGLSYYNPLLGGASDAQGVMMLGWGEGMDQIGAALESLPDAQDGLVLTSAWSTSISYFVRGMEVRTVKLDEPNALRSWMQADYYVWYVTASQRGFIPPEMEAYFRSLTPIRAVTLNGVRYAEIFEIRTAPLPAALTTEAIMAEVAPGLHLVEAVIPGDTVRPGRTVDFQLYLTGAVPDGERLPVYLYVSGFDGKLRPLGTRGLRTPSDGRSSWMAERSVRLPRGIPNGPYRLLARFGSEDVKPISLGVITVRWIDPISL